MAKQALAVLTLFIAACGGEDTEPPVTAPEASTERPETVPEQLSQEGQPESQAATPPSIAPPHEDAETTLRASIEMAGYAHIQNPDMLLEPYIEAGLITAEPDIAADYYHYYLLREPTRLLGYPLLAFETETMREAGWIGCCINAGLSILVMTDGNDEAAEAFARRNPCRIIGPSDWRFDYFSELSIPNFAVNREKYRLISCHDDDSEDDFPPS